MPRLTKTTIKIATQLFTYYAEKTLGDGALSTIVEGVTDLVGENAAETGEAFVRVDGDERVDAIIGTQFIAPAAFGRGTAQPGAENFANFHV